MQTNAIDLNSLDWDALQRLRAAFIDGSAGRADYWRSQGDLASYEQTFARRIGWKWDHVLAELKRRGWSPPGGVVLDWGCGSGVAGRAFVGKFGGDAAGELALWDRSRLAMEFAAAKVREEFPGLKVRVCRPSEAAPATLLVSHVLGELAPRQVDELVALAAAATAVIWVEPGTFEVSRALIAARERLRGQFQIVAPCTHQAACGLLTPENARHWCHHFAATPPQVFTDGDWDRFARLAGIDLRSLPLSYLVLDKRQPPALAGGAVRVIGRPRVGKAFALLFGCDESGVHDRRLLRKSFPEAFRAIKRDQLDCLQVWRCDGAQITSMSPALR